MGRKGVIKDLINIFSNNGIGAEIGIGKGGLSSNLLSSSCIKHLYLVDPWLGNYCEGDINSMSQEKMDTRYDKVVKRLSCFSDSCTILRKTSESASKDFPDEFFDFVYIDANHEFESVYNDLKCWVPKLKHGSLMMGDDWQKSFPGVRKAVVQFIMDYDPFLKPFENYKELGLYHDHCRCPSRSPVLNKSVNERQWWGIKK